MFFSDVKLSKKLRFCSVAEAHGLIYLIEPFGRKLQFCCTLRDDFEISSDLLFSKLSSSGKVMMAIFLQA